MSGPRRLTADILERALDAKNGLCFFKPNEASARYLAAQLSIAELCEAVQRVEAERDAALADVERMRAQKDDAYSQRNRLAVLLAAMLGGGLVDAVPKEPGWSKVLTFSLPYEAGQASFHLHDSELPYVLAAARIRYEGRPWDGHDDAEKWRRIALASGIAPPGPASPESES